MDHPIYEIYNLFFIFMVSDSVPFGRGVHDLYITFLGIHKFLHHGGKEKFFFGKPSVLSAKIPASDLRFP